MKNLNKAWLHTLGILVILMCCGITAMAAPVDVPEIDPGSVGAGLALLAGGYFVVVSKLRRK